MTIRFGSYLLYPPLKISFYSLIATLVAVLVAFVFWVPLEARQGELELLVDLRKAELDILQHYQLTGGKQTSVDRVVGYAKKLDSDYTDADLVAAVQRATQTSGLRMLKGQYKTSNEPAGLIIWTENLEVQGTYTQLRRLLSALDRLPVLTVIRRVAIEPTGSGDEVSVSLEVAVYRADGKV